MNKLKYHFLGGLVFLGTIVFGYIGYTAYTNLATQADGATITQTIWNDVINKVNTIGNTYAPTGAIMAFYLSSCPTGRIIADGTNGTPDLRGQFVRGASTSTTYDPDYTSRVGGLAGTNKVGSMQVDDFKSHSHGYTLSNGRIAAYAVGGGGNPFFYDYPNTQTSLAGGNETRPKNIALLYCMKQ